MSPFTLLILSSIYKNILDKGHENVGHSHLNCTIFCKNVCYGQSFKVYFLMLYHTNE